MNKYLLFIGMVFFLVVFTLIADSIDASTGSDILTTNIGSTEQPGILNILSIVWSYLGLFFRIILFQIEGIPVIFNLLIFYPLTAGTIFMLVDIIRGNS